MEFYDLLLQATREGADTDFLGSDYIDDLDEQAELGDWQGVLDRLHSTSDDRWDPAKYYAAGRADAQPLAEFESLRKELEAMRERYLEAERRVSEARGAIEDSDEPWIWSDDDTAETVDSLGNMMVVRITGGHLRSLIEAKAAELVQGPSAYWVAQARAACDEQAKLESETSRLRDDGSSDLFSVWWFEARSRAVTLGVDNPAVLAFVIAEIATITGRPSMYILWEMMPQGQEVSSDG